MRPCFKRTQPMPNVPLAIVSVYQHMSNIFLTPAYACAIHNSVTGPLNLSLIIKIQSICTYNSTKDVIISHRKCMLTDFGFTLASMELLFIHIARRYWVYDTGRAALNFHGFCDALLEISRRKLTMQRRSMQEVLLYILKHCELHVEKPYIDMARKPVRMLNKRPVLNRTEPYSVETKIHLQSSMKSLLQGPLV